MNRGVCMLHGELAACSTFRWFSEYGHCCESSRQYLCLGLGELVMGGGKGGAPRIYDIIDMITHGYKQVKEQFPPHLHFHLHGSTTLECFPATDDECEIMSAQPRITVRRVLVGIPCATQDGADLDPALQALLAQRELLELFEAVAVRSAVHGCVTENDVAQAGVKEGWLNGSYAVTFVWVGA